MTHGGDRGKIRGSRAEITLTFGDGDRDIAVSGTRQKNWGLGQGRRRIRLDSITASSLIAETRNSCWKDEVFICSSCHMPPSCRILCPDEPGPSGSRLRKSDWSPEFCKGEGFWGPWGFHGAHSCGRPQTYALGCCWQLSGTSS